MKTKQEQIEAMMLEIPQTIVAYNMDPKGQQLYGEQRLQIAEKLVENGYGDVTEYKAEINRLVEAKLKLGDEVTDLNRKILRLNDIIETQQNIINGGSKMKNQLLQETAAGLAMATAFTDGDFKGMSIILNTEGGQAEVRLDVTSDGEARVFVYKVDEDSTNLILAFEKKTDIGKKDLADAQEHLSSSVEGKTLGDPVPLKP